MLNRNFYQVFDFYLEARFGKILSSTNLLADFLEYFFMSMLRKFAFFVLWKWENCRNSSKCAWPIVFMRFFICSRRLQLYDFVCFGVLLSYLHNPKSNLKNFAFSSLCRWKTCHSGGVARRLYQDLCFVEEDILAQNCEF